MLSTAFFILFIVFLSSGISVWFFFIISISLLNFSFCSHITFLILLNCFSVFECSSLSSVKQLFWNLYWENKDVSCFLNFSRCHVSLTFQVPQSLALLSLHLKKPSTPPVFTDWLWERNTSFQPCWGFWGFLRSLLWIHLLYTSCSLMRGIS